LALIALVIILEALAGAVATSQLAVLDMLLLWAVGLIGASLVISERLLGRIQGIATLVYSLTVPLVGAAVTVYIKGNAKPNWTPDAAVGVLLGLSLAIKLGSAGCLVAAEPGFLKMKGLAAIYATSIGAVLLISFVYGILGTLGADIVAAIIVGIAVGVWTILFLIGAIPSIVSTIKLKG
jgi:hypothetical protein